VPAKPRPSDDPDERKRDLVIANEANELARDQNSADSHAGRSPTYGAGAMGVLAKRVAQAKEAVDELADQESA
jgi:hypothetical protein